MPQVRTFDLLNNILSGNSIAPGTSYSNPAADTDGSYVDCQTTNGPIHALCGVGAVSGSPTAMAINFELYEADATDGTGLQKIATQTEVTITNTSGNVSAYAQGIRTKRYVRVKIEADDSSYTDGSSPAAEVYAIVQGQKYVI